MAKGSSYLGAGIELVGAPPRKPNSPSCAGAEAVEPMPLNISDYPPVALLDVTPSAKVGIRYFSI